MRYLELVLILMWFVIPLVFGVFIYIEDKKEEKDYKSYRPQK